MLRRLIAKTACLGLLIILATSCASPGYQITRPNDAAINRAVVEISSSRPISKRSLSVLEAREKLGRIYTQLRPSAGSLCRSLAERSGSSCRDWQVVVEDSQVYNAYATGSSEIVLSKGLFEQSRYDEEIAFVLAHELSHHILDHINEDQRNASVGTVLGVLLTVAISDAVFGKVQCDSRYEDCDELYETAADIVQTGADVGAYIANQKYSVRQESEADLVAAYILSRSEFNLIRAREALLNLGRMDKSSTKRSSFFDSHPAGPERLAQFDAVIQEVLSNTSRSP